MNDNFEQTQRSLIILFEDNFTLIFFLQESIYRIIQIFLQFSRRY